MGKLHLYHQKPSELREGSGVANTPTLPADHRAVGYRMHQSVLKIYNIEWWINEIE